MNRRIFKADAAAKQQGTLTIAAGAQPVGRLADLLKRDLAERSARRSERISQRVASSQRQQHDIARAERDPSHRRSVQPALALSHKMEPGGALGRKVDSPGATKLAATIGS